MSREGDDDRSNAGHDGSSDSGTDRSRRRFLAVVGSTAGVTALAGCGGNAGQSNPEPESTPESATDTAMNATTGGESPAAAETETGTGTEEVLTADDLYNIEQWRGEGPVIDDRPERYRQGVSVLDLPDLRGELTVYLGGGEGGLYQNLIKRIQNLYQDFTVYVRVASSAQLANTIVEETTANRSPADIFWPIDAGSVGIVAENDATAPLPNRVTDAVPETYAPTDKWVGIMGRARSVPFNTNHLNASDVPSDVFAFAENPGFRKPMGWAPTYGAFQSFITAMRLLNGRGETKAWLNAMQEQGIRTYDNEFVVANAVANGELSAGFSNHYYSRLVFEERPQAPLELAFTNGDAGALVNCSAAGILRGSGKKQLAANFIHHLLSIEAQEFLCTRGYEYPLLPSVPPVGDLPPIDELNPPGLNLAKLADLEPTLRLLREVGVL